MNYFEFKIIKLNYQHLNKIYKNNNLGNVINSK